MQDARKPPIALWRTSISLIAWVGVTGVWLKLTGIVTTITTYRIPVVACFVCRLVPISITALDESAVGIAGLSVKRAIITLFAGVNEVVAAEVGWGATLIAIAEHYVGFFDSELKRW